MRCDVLEELLWDPSISAVNVEVAADNGAVTLSSTIEARKASCAADAEAYIQPLHFADVLAGDLPPDKTNVLAAAQRPASLSAFSEKTQFAAWHSVPSFAVIPTEDHAIGAANERVMAQRANAQIVEVKASHLVMVSHPNEVVKLIDAAASNVGQ